MNKTIAALVLLMSALSASAQTSASNSGSLSGSDSTSTSGANSAAIGNLNASRSDSASNSGASSGSVSGAAGNVIVFNPGSAGATTQGAGGIPTTRVINQQDGATRAEQILSGGVTNTDRVQYSGTVENRSSGGTTNTDNVNYHYSGTQTIKSTPAIALSGPASAPCGGVSGSIGLAGPGFGLGGNFAKEDVACTARENTRVLGMAAQSLDGAANPQEKGEALAAMMEGVRIIRTLNEKIASDTKAK